MDQMIGSDEARRRFRELLDAVEHKGEHVTVRRYGTPGVVIVPVGWYDRARALIGEEGPS